MSYGFDLMRLPSGRDRAAALRRWLEAEEARGLAIDPGPPDPEKEATKERLAEALLAEHAGLRRHVRDDAASARALGIDRAEACARLRRIELDDDAAAIRIVLFDDSAGVTLASGRVPCAEALRIVWGDLRVLERMGGFATYDPQAGRLLDLAADLEAVRHLACGGP